LAMPMHTAAHRSFAAAANWWWHGHVHHAKV
jgi:hypothetical protein